MRKTESTAARRKSAYICPKIVCIAVEYSLCAGSNPIPGGHENAGVDPIPMKPEDGEEEEE